MLCTSHYKVGLLGSSFFVGVIVTIYIVPAIADQIGRRLPFICTMVVTVIAQFYLMLTSSLDHALITMVILGMTFPGKNIVGLNYLLEFMMKKN